MATSLLDQLQPFVGMNLDQFESKAKELGYETRVVSKDGESVPVTMDLRNDRVNVIVTTNQDGKQQVTSLKNVA